MIDVRLQAKKMVTLEQLEFTKLQRPPQHVNAFVIINLSLNVSYIKMFSSESFSGCFMYKMFSERRPSVESPLPSLEEYCML